MNQASENPAVDRHRVLLGILHTCLSQYQRSAVHLPALEALRDEMDLHNLILKEAIAARNNQLPRLSLVLLEQAIAHGFDSCWIVNNKALALRQMGDLSGAIAAWSELADLEGRPDFSLKVAAQLKATQQQLAEQRQSQRMSVLAALHESLDQAKRSAVHLPELEALSDEMDLHTLILKEAIAARNDHLPQLSLVLLEQAMAHGFDSCWIVNNKALALRQMGDLSGAIAAWSELADLEGRPDFSLKVAAQLKATQQQLAEQRQSQRMSVLAALHESLDQAKRSAVHLPELEALSDEMDLHTLILKEAIAARNDHLPQLSLVLLEQAMAHGFDSCWIVNNKALALREMKDLTGAIAIWTDLASIDGLPAFRKTVEELLKTAQQQLAGQSQS